MRSLFFTVLFFTSGLASAQVQVGLFGGLSNYQGDLIDKPFQASRGAFGITGGYAFNGRLSVRAGLTFARLAGADSLSDKTYLQQRNFSFQSNLTEFSLRGEYSIFSMDNMRWSPYLFAGLAVYRYNPYTFDRNNNKVFLQPLGTEGQGIEGYPQTSLYKLTQLSIPFGGGFKYAISDKVGLGLEMGVRKLFTDHLDDVSTNYAGAADLLAARGPLAVDIAYRGDEAPGGDPAYPAKGAQRGGAEIGDWYYFTGLHLTINLGDLPGGGGRMGSGRGRNRGYGCPPVGL